MTTARVRVRAEAVRGFWLTDVGQRVTGFVPAGVYDVGPHVEIPGRGLFTLLTGTDGISWYVTAQTAADLRKC